uniref:Galectin n=1 Tax=Acrobeloides nanus TaxID=290746 RepID=A0A914E962_9BILA
MALPYDERSYPIPYKCHLQDRFEPGQTIIVRGKVNTDAKRFSINLHNRAANFEGDDIPLHISIRFDEGKIVFNSFARGHWEKEERVKNPLKKGEDFDFRIRVHDNRFQVYAERKELHDYDFRLPLSSVTHFSVDGDVQLHDVQWGGKYYPVPYESGIPDGLDVGRKLVLYGIVEKNAKKFEVNLLKRTGDVALHFNPRFSEKHVIRNAMLAGNWGNEEREGKNPFEKGYVFDLVITNKPYELQIYVNGVHFGNFAHRSDPHDINGLQIQGDVEITGIQVR